MKKLTVLILFILITYLGVKELRHGYETATVRLNQENHKATKIVAEYNDLEKRRRILARINRVFRKYNSPMVGTEDDLLAAVSKFGIDWRLALGIALKESTMGVHGCGYNPFGIASCRIRFGSYSEAYEYLARLLATSGYYKKWRSTGELYDLMSVYCPESDNCDTRLYVAQLTNFMEDL